MNRFEQVDQLTESLIIGHARLRGDLLRIDWLKTMQQNCAIYALSTRLLYKTSTRRVILHTTVVTHTNS